MSRTGPEFTDVQKPALELLRDKLGYRYVPGEQLAVQRSSDSEVILLEVFAERLRAINPGITDNGIRDAVEAIRQPLARNLMEANEACHLHMSAEASLPHQVSSSSISRILRTMTF
jgi:hypothetical protein